VAVLSFNLETHGSLGDGPITMTPWNVTSVYALIDGRWKIVHQHFSDHEAGPLSPPPVSRAGACG